METNEALTRLGDGEKPTLHSYFDVCPESPDESRVIATEFLSSAVPGPARIVVLDRAGERIEVIGDPEQAIGHVGRFAVWLDDERVAYREGTEEAKAGYTIRNLVSGAETSRFGALRQWHIITQRGLVQWQGRQRNPNSYAQGVRVTDGEGCTTAEIDIADIHDALPDEARAPEPESIDVRNLKWSPDGETFMAVVTDENYRVRVLGDVDARSRFKCIVLCSPDCSSIHYLGNFTHHPAWAPDGSGITCMERRDAGGPQDLLLIDRDGTRTTLLRDVEGIHGSLNSRMSSFIIDEREPDRRFGHIARHRLGSGSREDLVRFSHEKWEHTTGHHPHPVFSRSEDRIYFNAAEGGVCGLYTLELRTTI